MRKNIAILSLALVGWLFAAVLVGLFAGWIWGRLSVPSPQEARPKIADTSNFVRQIQSLAQLVTVKYQLEKVVVIEDAKWFGENRLIMVAHGVAKAGFDLSRVQVSDVQWEGGKLILKLHRPILTDVFLDDRRTEIIERSTGTLRAFDKDLEQDARRQAVERLRIAAVDAGILKEAEERARLQFDLLARQLGFQSLELVIQR